MSRSKPEGSFAIEDAEGDEGLRQFLLAGGGWIEPALAKSDLPSEVGRGLTGQAAPTLPEGGSSLIAVGIASSGETAGRPRGGHAPCTE
jgi:hypothetical protein